MRRLQALNAALCPLEAPQQPFRAPGTPRTARCAFWRAPKADLGVPRRLLRPPETPQQTLSDLRPPQRLSGRLSRSPGRHLRGFRGGQSRIQRLETPMTWLWSFPGGVPRCFGSPKSLERLLWGFRGETVHEAAERLFEAARRQSANWHFWALLAVSSVIRAVVGTPAVMKNGPGQSAKL